jgi:uncharacterized protein YndB with AHSA1/START domain
MSNFLYSVEREYPVAIEELWDAWLNPEKLEVWYAPTDLRVLPGSVESEPKVDGWWTVGVDVSQFGFVAYFYGKYLEIIEHQLITHTLYYTQSETEFKQRDLTAEHHLIKVEFESRGKNSWVKFAQFGELPNGEADQAKAGMESYFDNLANFLTA